MSASSKLSNLYRSDYKKSFGTNRFGSCKFEFCMNYAHTYARFFYVGGGKPPSKFHQGVPLVSKRGPRMIKKCIYLLRQCFMDLKQ